MHNSDHFETSTLIGIGIGIGIGQAKKNGDFSAIRILAAIGAKEGASKYCVELAEKAIDLLALREEVNIEMFFCLE